MKLENEEDGVYKMLRSNISEVEKHLGQSGAAEGLKKRPKKILEEYKEQFGLE